jgi:predicted RNA-binding protein YlxR (DUF448 family)
MIVCALHGFLFGTLFAPMQALFFNLDFNGKLNGRGTYICHSDECFQKLIKQWIQNLNL